MGRVLGACTMAASLVASLLAATLAATAAATPAAAHAQGRAVELVVAATTDVHGRLRGWDYYADTAEAARGLARVATIVDSLRAAHPGRVILVDAGDLLQGNPLTYAAARIDTGAPHPVIAAMNLMRYDAAAVGNHEFNYGLPALDRALAAARFPFLAANAKRTDRAAPWRAFTIVERAGVKVGIVGVTNPGVMVWDRDNVAGRVTVGEMIPALRGAVHDARALGADVIVVVAHGGLSGASSYDTVATGLGSENPMARVAREVPGIDLIVYGHSHREVADTTINGVLLTQPRNWATSVSVAHLQLEQREQRGGAWRAVAKRASLVPAAGHPEQGAVVAAVERAHAAARRYAGTVVGQALREWRSDSARVADTPLMDFVAEVMRKASGADLASVAAFSIDVKIPAGAVSIAQLAQLYPYDNTLRAVRITGAQLRAYLEQSARYFRVTGSGAAARAAPDPSIPGYNYEIVTGADYTIDLARPAGERITRLAVRGTPVRNGDTFTMALSNYRAGGAGGYAMVARAPVTHDRQLEVRQLLIDEVTRRGTLSEEHYFTPNWRIVPERLGAEVYAALRRAPGFDAVGPAPPPPAAAGTAPPAPQFIRIIATNDFHGALEPRPDGNAGLRGGAAHLAATIRRAERECAPACATLLLDGGDLFQGTPASNLAFGRPVVELFNALGYAATALGNHEFDWGQDTLRARMKDARFAILGANVRTADGRDVGWIRDDTLVERGGVRIGVVGIARPQTPSSSKPENVRGLRFDEAAPVVDAHARSLRARGAEIVVVVAHIGAFCDRDTGCRGEIVDVARSLTEPVDAIVSGHTHTLVAEVVRGIPIVQARVSGRAIGVLDLPLDPSARARARPEVRDVVTDAIAPDAGVDSLVRAAMAPVRELVSRPIATVAETMDRRGPQYALGNFIADAQRAAAQTDVAVMNSTGIRADLRAGPATYGSFFEVAPFGNLLVRVTVRGRDLRAYVESLVSRDEPRVHVSGLAVRFDRARPAGSRIVAATVGGTPLDDARTYTLAYNDFMAAGGDGLGLAAGALRQETLNVVDLDALIAWAKAQPGGVVQPDAAPRITPVTP